MTISNKGIELIKSLEGLRLKAYKSPAGVWTIGYGHTGGVDGTCVISKKMADDLLRLDLQTTIIYSAHNNQNQFDAIRSFVFNVGSENYRKSTLCKKILADPNDPTIRDEFMKWVYADGKRLEGLVKRRTAEADLYFSNDG